MDRYREKIGKKIYIFIYLISLFLFDFLFRLVYKDVGYYGIGYWVPMVFSLLWSVLFSAIAFVLQGTLRRVYMIVLSSFFALLGVANAVIRLVSGSFLSFSDMAFAEDGAAFISIEYFKINPWIYVIAVLFILISVFCALSAPDKNKYNALTISIPAALFAVSFILLIVMNWYYNVDYSASKTEDRFRWTDTYDVKDPTVIYSEFTNADQSFCMTGSYQYLFRSIVVGFIDPIFADNDISSIDEYFEKRNLSHSDNEMSGVFKDKNVICIMMESIDNWMITPEYMPHLYDIMQDSINFNNHYTPLFLTAGTFNTEFAFNCGYYLPATGTNAKTYATNEYPDSIANLFSRAGYVPRSYHLLNGKYYNRQVVHKLWGYESYNTLETLGVGNENSLDSTLMKAYDYMFREEKNFSYIITYSGHGPYNDGMKHISDEHIDQAKEAVAASNIEFPSANTKMQYIYAISHIMETDKFLGELVDRLKSDGHIEDTVLVIFGDHWSKYLTDKEFVMDIKGVEDENMLYNTPLMIYSADTYKYDDIEKVTSSIDIIPTLCNLFGIEFDQKYMIGTDAYSDDGGIVAFKDYSWYDGEIYYNENYDGEITSYIDEKNKSVYDLLNTSWEIVKKNYFHYKK